MTEAKKVHLIAIGGSIMHNLAIALHQKGIQVTGSDDGFFEPSKSRLAKHSLLPDKEGWDVDHITEDLDAVILGMHAKEDNPELKRAQELGVKIYSFPEYIYEQSKHKQRIVIAGSHGKTTVTSMVMHVLNYYKRDFDYAVGAQLKGFDTMVRLTDAPYIIIEGDEYLSSALDMRPKFFNYQHHIVLMNGIAWDHMNVFPTYAGYRKQFEDLAKATPKAGTIIYNTEDTEVKDICENHEADILKFKFSTPKHEIIDGVVNIIFDKKKYPMKIVGTHNITNLGAAQVLCARLCVREAEFLKAMQSFEGAGKRLEVLREDENRTFYRDFAHAPSKLRATVEGMKDQFPSKKLTGFFELHTFSSLNKEFLQQYKGSFDAADKAVVFLDPEVVAKKGGELSNEDVLSAFDNSKIEIVNTSEELKSKMKAYSTEGNILFMSSGNFGGIDVIELSQEL